MKILGSARSILVAGTTALLIGCGDATGTQAELGGAGIRPIIAGYVDTWIDLNVHFGRAISMTSIGTEPALELRFNAGHHEVRCVAVKRYAYVQVSFNGVDSFLEPIDCQPRLLWVRPQKGQATNFSELFRNVTPPRTVAGLQGDTNKLTIFQYSFDVHSPGMALQAGDFGIVCLVAGEVVLHVDFEPNAVSSSEDYTLVCVPSHGQGAGS